MTDINWINVSGGKDSTALLLWTIEEELPNCRYVFADTGNESPLLYEYLDYLEYALPVTIERVETEGFLNLCKRKGLFPSPLTRFCTQHLKLYPLAKHMDAAEDCTHQVWVGVRAEESPARASLPPYSGSDVKYPPRKTSKQIVQRPLLDWTWQDVFEIHKRNNIKPNPLYLMGMNRVGCFPCIMAKNSELREMFRRFPEVVDRLRGWESQVSASSNKPGSTSFFPWEDLPKGCEGGIDTFAAYLDKGDVFPEFEDHFDGCTSQYGLCE